MTPSVYQEIWEMAAEILAYRPHPDICDWAEQNIVLAGPTETNAGPLNLNMTPYLRGPLRAGAERQTTDVTICAATQVAKTTFLRILLAFLIATIAAGAALWVWPNEKLAKAFSKRRWKPVVRSSPGLRDLIPEDEDDFNNLNQIFGGRWAVRFEGSGSDANVSSEPASLVIADEVDKLDESDEKEAPAIHQADERTKAYKGSAKRIKAGTPTLESAPVWKNFMLGTREYYYVPCPHCTVKFTPVLANLKYPDCKLPDGTYDLEKVVGTAFLECPACAQPIREQHKTAMLAAGEWRATNPKPAPGHRSFHLNTLLSPFVTWANMAMEHCKAKVTPGGLHNFVNSWLAEPWRADAFNSDPKELARVVVEGHHRGDRWGDFVILIVDVQRAELHWLARGYGPGESRFIDHGTVGTWEDIDAIQEKFNAFAVGVDSGFGERANEVYRAVFDRRAKGWVALKGWETSKVPLRLQRVNPFTGDQRRASVGAVIPLLHINNAVFHADIFAARQGQLDGWKVCADVGNDTVYTSELFAVYPKEKRDRFGRTKIVSTATRAEHCFDMENYQRAMAFHLRLIGPRTRFSAPTKDETAAEDKAAEAAPVAAASSPAAPLPNILSTLEKVQPGDPDAIGKKPAVPPRKKYIPISQRRPPTGDSLLAA